MSFLTSWFRLHSGDIVAMMMKLDYVYVPLYRTGAAICDVRQHVDIISAFVFCTDILHKS